MNALWTALRSLNSEGLTSMMRMTEPSRRRTVKLSARSSLDCIFPFNWNMHTCRQFIAVLLILGLKPKFVAWPWPWGFMTLALKQSLARPPKINWKCCNKSPHIGNGKQWQNPGWIFLQHFWCNLHFWQPKNGFYSGKLLWSQISLHHNCSTQLMWWSEVVHILMTCTILILHIVHKNSLVQSSDSRLLDSMVDTANTVVSFNNH